MKKLSILALAIALTATMFAGCRRNPGTTGPSTTMPAQTTTTMDTMPHSSTTRPSGSTAASGGNTPEGSSGPQGTEMMPETPEGTTGTGFARRVLPPRY